MRGRERLPAGVTVPYDWALAQMRVPAAHTVTRGSKDVVIAVIDLGYGFHPDHAGHLWANPYPTRGDVHGWDFADDDDSLEFGGLGADSEYSRSHHAFVVGEVAAVAPERWIMVLRVGYEPQHKGSWERAVRYAVEHGARVLVIPHGYLTLNPETGQPLFYQGTDFTSPGDNVGLLAAFDDAYRAGCLIFRRGGVCRSSFPLSHPSFPLAREGGFTFEVQHVVPEHFRRGPVVQTLAGRIIVQLHQLRKPGVRQGRQVGLAGQPAAQAPDGVFDPSFLPGRVGVTAEGFDPEGMELVVAGELGTIVEGDRLPPGGGQGPQQSGEGGGNRGGRFAGGPDGEQQAGVAFMYGQHRLAIGAEEHQIGFPMARGLAVGSGGGPFFQGPPVADAGGGAAAPAPAPAPAPLGAGEVVTPGPVRLGAGGLGVDEAIDGLVGDDGLARLPPEPASDLLWRPAVFEAGEHPRTERGIPVETGAAPAPGAGLLLGIAGLVALLAGGIAL